MAYTADINIVVKGQAAVSALQKALHKVGERIDEIAQKRIGPAANLDTFNKQLRETEKRLNEVVAGTTDETQAIKNYVTALGNANAAVDRQNKLIQNEINLRESATKSVQELADLQQYLYEKQRQLENSKLEAKAVQVQEAFEKQAAAAKELGDLQQYLYEKQRQLENSKLDEEAARLQKEFDKQAEAAAESAAQIDKLNQTQTAFIERTNEAARAAARQTSEFIRQQRIAKEVAQLTANAPAPQLLLPAAAPGSPAMSGGARRQITGPVERLGGARTEDQAAMALRFAEALKEQVRPLSQINSLYAGIYGEAVKLAGIKALPSSEMLNAAARGLQTIEAIEGRRLSTAERRAKKLRDIQDYYGDRIGDMANAGFGVQGPAVPPGGVKPRKAKGGLQAPGVMDAILGAGFPALFGGGPGAILGGAAGGLIGGSMGGMAGMALSVALSAVGQQLDAMVKKFADLGEAIRTLNVDAVRDSYIFVNKELSMTLDSLLKVGEYEKARAVLAQEAARQTGASVQQIEAANSAMNQLQGAWAQVTRAVGGLVSIVLTGFLQGITAVLNVVSLIAVGASKVISFTRNIVDSTLAWLAKLLNIEKFYNNLKNIIPFISEEQEKIRAAAEAEIDSGIKDLQLRKQKLEIEKQILDGSNRAARLSQQEGQYKKEALDIERNLEKEIEEINRKSGDLTAEQVRNKINIAKANAEIELKELNITRQKAEQRILNESIIAGLQDQANALQTQANQYAKVQSSVAEILQIELQRMQQRMQFVTSLNQESALINQMAAKRKELAEVEYQAAVAAANSAVQQAAAEYDIVQAKYKQNDADIEQVNAAQRKLQTAVQARGLDIEIAGLKREQALETAEIERRQQQLNAYAEEYSRINERISRELDAQSNALNNRASLLSAISQATQTINNIEIESLTRELERTSSVREREKILEKIYRLEVANAKAVLEATRAQIQAELQRAEIAYRKVLLEQKMLEAVVAIARAQGVVTREHYEALEIQQEALQVSKHNVDTAAQIADVQWKAADAVFKAAVDAAKLKKEMGGAASAAGQFAGNMERAASAAQGISGIGQKTTGAPFAAYGGAMAIEDPVLRKVAMAIWERASADAARMARSGASSGVAGLPNAEREIAKIALAERKMREEEQKRNEQQNMQQLVASGALSKYPYEIAQQIRALAGTTAAEPRIVAAEPSPTPIPTTQPLAMGLSMQPGGGAGTAIVDRMPTINLQTGPVLQQDDGNKYVSLGDLEKILQDFAAVVFNNARSTGGRRFQGVA